MTFDFPPADLMVIGDSLAQGCRSLTVNKEFCAQSWAARVAQAQGWRFVTPDFPIPVLFDLEAEVRRLDTATISLQGLQFTGFFGRVRDNLTAWLAQSPTSAFTCFDNLGLAGCLVDDLYSRTARSSAAEIAKLAPQGATEDLLLGLHDRTIGDLHLAINARFTLNPSRDPELDDLTPIGWVQKRRPKTLFVQVGHNHGLYRIGADAELTGDPADSFTRPGGPGHAAYFDQWAELAGHLAQLPDEVETILVVLLPKVGAVANLRPRGVERDEGYAETYEPVLSTSTAILSGSDLRAIDGEIQKANETIRGLLTGAATPLGRAGRMKFVDTFTLFEARDFKNLLDARLRIPVDPAVTIDNRYLDSKQAIFPPFGRRLTAGGFQSIDGMHATGCGYADLAAEAMNVLGLPHDRAALLRRALVEDSLLSRYPVELDVLVGVLALARKLQHVGHIDLQPSVFFTEQAHISDELQMMKQVFKRG
jgi:hypothetical protein